jgi:tetratricopeptide (TPR) repeat protein
MGIIVLIIILGVVVGFVTFLVVKSVIKPKQVSTLAQLVKQNRNSQAVRVAKKIIGDDPRNADAHYLLGLAYLADDKPELALMEFKTVNQIGQFGKYAREVPFRKKIAELYQKFNQPEEALKEYLLLVKKEPGNTEHYLQAGVLFEERDRSDRAAEFYRKAIELDAHNASAHLRLGKLLYRQKKPLEAREFLQRAVKADPDCYEAYYYVGRIQKENKDHPAALAAFERAQKDPEFKIKAIVERGATFLSMNNLDSAVPELERAIKLAQDETAPEVLYARYFLASAYEKNRYIEKAIEQWERIYTKRPRFRDVAEKLSQYEELRSDDQVKDFMTVSEDQFIEMCQHVTTQLGLTIREVTPIRDGCEVLAVEPQSKWRNARKMPKLLRFLRVADTIDESTVRALHEDMKSQNISRGMLLTSGTFSRLAMDFAETRPIELYNKEHLQSLLKGQEPQKQQ